MIPCIAYVLDTDVLVIGGGGAACRAAIAAHDAGARTLLALKGELGASGATTAPGRGVAWQVADDCSSPEDGPDVHLANILDAGLGMADPDLARILAHELPAHTAEMERWGLCFIPDPTGQKAHYSAYSCFGDQPRAHGIPNSGHGHAGDIVMVLQKQIAARGLLVRERLFVVDLIVRDGVCCGAVALDADGEAVLVRAGAVVLGTGGARQLFPPETDRLIDTTGDGYAMALRAGATLGNMEFTQYMLRLDPQGQRLDVPGFVWALYPTLRNARGEEILSRYLPSGVGAEEAMWARTLHHPFSCRDASGWLDIAIAIESQRTGYAWVDFSDVDLERFVPSRPNHLPEDMTRRPILPEGPVLVRNTAHAVNGGVVIDAGGASMLPGLYAAGEVAGGPHGADRLGGGMVTNCQVFGARAGRHAAAFALGGDGASTHVAAEAREVLARRLGRFGGGGDSRDVEAVFQRLQAATEERLMVMRDTEGLAALLRDVEALLAEELPAVDVAHPATLRRAIEAENSLLTAQMMATAALLRRESRGSHFRADYPQRDDARWVCLIALRLIDGQLCAEV
jgi:fumarate reductase (CoM/CoB) subunit A